MPQRSYPLFSLGRTVATRGALDHLAESGIPPGLLLERHATGEWGDLTDADNRSNHQAVRDGGRILSAYVIDAEKVYVITEADRSCTTILLASEY